MPSRVKRGFDVLKEFGSKMDAGVDAGIKKAQEAGIKVSRKDFAFPDWDPTKDYEPKKK